MLTSLHITLINRGISVKRDISFSVCTQANRQFSGMLRYTIDHGLESRIWHRAWDDVLQQLQESSLSPS